MMINSSDLSARLLATENISVVRARTRTASFDIKSRVLTLPMWKDMTPDVEGMLIGHEVGHALYTTEEYMAPIKETGAMQSYMNVLEDVRIEKMIKRKYPGLRKTMNEGYKQLNDKDFFGVKQVQDMSTLLLIDRINLYFKAGYSCGVQFTPEEKMLVNRAERTETVQDVIDLAKDIYAYSKKEIEERKKNASQSPEDIEEDEEEYEDPFDDGEDVFEEFDDQQEDDFDKKSYEKPSNEKQENQNQEATDEELESKTSRAFDTKVQDLADESTEYHYYELDDREFPISPIISFKTLLNDSAEVTKFYDGDESYLKRVNEEVDKFKQESQRVVNYLVKEFEMKKSAQLYKRAQTAKIGSLDMRKVWSYKLNDDLFKRVTAIPQGKNHGMVFLLDWSGSMDYVIRDTLKQVINLAMFCNRVQIPYQVFAFSTQYDICKTTEDWDKFREFNGGISPRNTGKRIVNSRMGNWSLLELFSNKMTTSEFNSMVRRILDPKIFWIKGFDLGGTPLNESLLYMYQHYVGKFIKNNNVEKMTLITLTDGEGAALDSNYSRFEDREYVRRENAYGYDWVKRKHFIRDEITKKTYEITRDSTAQTEMILRMTKDRYDISIVGFYICRNTRRELSQAIKCNIPDFNGDTTTLIETMRKEFRDSGFTVFRNTGRDDLFIIPQTSTKIEEGELTADSDMKASTLARNFSKYLNTKKTSRILLNRFIERVA